MILSSPLAFLRHGLHGCSQIESVSIRVIRVKNLRPGSSAFGFPFPPFLLSAFPISAFPRPPPIRLRSRRKPRNLSRMSELVFEVTQEEDGGFCAECLSENIFTQGDTWEVVRKNVQEAVRAYYFDQPQAPQRIRLHLVRDELLAGA